MAFFACMLILVLLTAPLTLLFRGRRFEELLPASLFGAILVLYLFAMFHQLRAGATAVLALAIAGFLFVTDQPLTKRPEKMAHFVLRSDALCQSPRASQRSWVMNITSLSSDEART